MSSLGYPDLLRLLDEVQRVQQAQTLKITLEAIAEGAARKPAPALARAPVQDSASPNGEAALTAVSPNEPVFDSIRVQSMIYEETHRIRDLLLARIEELNRSSRLAASERAPSSAADGERPWSDAYILSLLDKAQLALLKHPTAAQAAFSALVGEGRRFARTAEGAEWLDALSTSSFIRRARWVWETTSLNMLEEDETTVVPSTYLEALLRAAEGPDMDQVLSRVKGMGHE
jgi:hypothetical protein